LAISRELDWLSQEILVLFDQAEVCYSDLFDNRFHRRYSVKKIIYILLLGLAACATEIAQDGEETQVSETTQELSVCISTCDPPTYDGVLVSCSSNNSCFSSSDGAYCLQDSGYWQSVKCRLAVPPPPPPPPTGPVCGNGICEGGEGVPQCDCVQDCSNVPTNGTYCW
jgi:hypothetical protein